MSGYFSADVFWEGHSHLDFDRRQIRKAMRAIGADIRKDARKRVARRAISSADEAPGKRTGALQRAIRYRVSRPGLLVKVGPEKTQEMGADFYPAFLNYGVRRGKGGAASEASGWRLAPRANYMEDALEARKANARQVLSDSLARALVARK